MTCNTRDIETNITLSAYVLHIVICVTNTLRYITIILEVCIIFVICYKQGRKAI